MEKTRLPEELSGFIKGYHEYGIKDSDCQSCNSACCSYSGFALLENVEQIYEFYRKGMLKKQDYNFLPNLNFKQFVTTYFDICYYEKIIFFNPKHLSLNNQLLSIPLLEDYWETRSELFESNPWLSQGCIFLDQKINYQSKDKIKRACLLHTEDYQTHLGPKPLACVFFTCIRPREFKLPKHKDTQDFFEMLSEIYPDSIERFEGRIK
jgi:hypothetical protein